ncbi:MAG: PAS domain S-box protein [Verrucomicrobiaceae bacterium]|nr:PAS domain S-box protein [Verrucomicrobiaceae bacterium]
MAGAQVVEEPKFLAKSWQTIDGLPQNSVMAIAQTPDGYLWLGTRGGLARFDGVRFVHYGLADGLKGLHVSSLIDDGQGGLWIATRGGGLSRWRNGVISTLTAADGLARNDVLAIAPAEPGALWIGTGSGLQHWGPDGFQQVGEAEGVRGIVNGMAVSPTEGLWFSVHGVEKVGLFRCQGGRCEFVEPVPKSRALFPSSLFVDAEGALWLGMGNGVVLRRQAGVWKEFNQTDGVPFSYIYCFAQGPSGEIWAGSYAEGLFVFRGGRFHAVPQLHGAIRSVRVSRDGVAWAGTETGGLTRLTRPRVTSFPLISGTQSWKATGLVEDPPDRFWVTAYGGGLFRGTLDALEPVMSMNEPGPIGNPFINACLKMRDGTVFFAAPSRLWRKEVGTENLSSVALTINPRALCEDESGSLWLGGYAGELMRLVDGAPQAVENGKFPAPVTALVPQKGPVLWASTEGGGLFRWEAGQVRRWTTAEGLPTDILFSLYQDTDGTLWIGTAGGGLAWLQDGRIHSVNTRQGLGDDVISQILEDDLGNLWLGCNRGIFRVSKSELQDVAAGRAATVHSLALDESDGMSVAECTGGRSPAGLRGRSGTLYFSTVRGVVAVDPSQFGPAPSPPAVLLEEVKLNGKAIPVRGGALTLPPGPRDLEIHYTAFNYAKPEQIHFRHRLTGGDEEWAYVDGARSVRYFQLKPGDYTFQVSAANPDQHWNETGARLAFTVLPFFWQTTWFRVAISMLLMLLGGGLVRWRHRERRRRELAEMEHLRRETAERQRADERFRLAVESSLSGIVLVNDEGRILLVNARTEKLFGYQREELIGQTVEMLLPQRLRGGHPDHRAGFAAHSQAGTMGAGRDLLAQRKDGTEFPVEISLSPMKTEEGVLVLAAIADITARRQSEQELALQRNELAHLSRVSLLGKLAGTIAHELNQPLAAMLSNSQVGRRMIDDGHPDMKEMTEILDDITADAKRAGGIIHGMRAMFKKETPMDSQPLNLNAKVNQVLGLLHSEIIERKAKVELHAAESLPKVMAGRVEIQQVLINLIMNSLDATKSNVPGTARIDITTEHRDGRVIVSVRDNGPGIAKEMQDKLFEAFATSKPSGLGLGLSISDGIVKQFGGSLHGENHPEGGAVFRLELPVMMS